MIRISLVFLVFCICSHLYGQEICDNGIDDDFDGFIDCYDSECNGNSFCNDSYFQNLNQCDFEFPLPLKFELKEKWKSSVLTDTRGTLVAGDLDNDCIPEIIAHSETAGELYILNGISGEVELQILAAPNSHGWHSPVIGDVDLDGEGEIFFVRNPSGKIYCYETDGTTKWSSTINLPDGNWSVSLADFNEDGTAELYSGNLVFDATTGAHIATGTESVGAFSTGNQAFPVAMDVLPDAFCGNCDGLELVCGDDVYSVDIGSSTINLEVSVIGITGDRDGQTAVGDVDGNSQLDVVVSTRDNNKAQVYGYDAQTGVLLPDFGVGNNPFVLVDHFTNSAPSNFCGRPVLSDVDGDNKLEIIIAGKGFIGVIDDDFTELWSQYIQDVSSAVLSSSIFDLDGDGFPEIIFRDEDSLIVFEGHSGVRRATIPCGSASRMENPIVLDADIDGKADIVCTCADNPGDILGYPTLFSGNDFDFVSTRNSWPSSIYNPTMFLDDLKIPTVVQNTITIPEHNNFGQQSRLFDGPMNPLYTELPEFSINLDSVRYGGDPCLDSHQVFLTICNIGGQFFPEDFEISVYQGDPLLGGSLMKNRNYSMNPIIPSLYCQNAINTICIRDSFNISPGDYEFFMVANDDGTDPVNAPVLSDDECSTTDNISSELLNQCFLPLTKIALSGKAEKNGNHLSVILDDKPFGELIWERKIGAFFEIVFIKKINQNSYLDKGDEVFGKNVAYRVSSITEEGESIMSKVLYLNNENFSAGHLRIYPNPCSKDGDIKVIGLEMEESEIHVSIFSLNGQMVFTDSFQMSPSGIVLPIDFLGLAGGIYLMELRTSTFRKMEKVIIK